MNLKMKMTDWEYLSIRVLVLGFTVFMWSFFTEIPGVHSLFGDVLEKKYSYSSLEWTWGFRHYVYTITFAILTGIQAIRIVKWVDKLCSDTKNPFPVDIRD